MHTINARLLGVAAFAINGIEVEGLRLSEGGDLLRFMAVYARPSVDEETVFRALASGVDESVARHRLDTWVWGAKSVVGRLAAGSSIVRRRGGVCSWTVRVECDYLDLLTLSRTQAVKDARRALALCAGKFCLGEKAEWKVSVRNEVSTIAGALLERVEQDGRAEDFDYLLRTGLQLQSQDWTNERVLRVVMRTHERCGRIHDALRAYDRFSRLLERELGMDPEPETTALRDRILGASSLPNSPPGEFSRFVAQPPVQLS